MVTKAPAEAPAVKLRSRSIGPKHPLFFIAEIGINHNQDFELATKLIDAAADAGCDAAKFQTFKARDLYIEGAKAGTYRLMGKDIPIYDLHTGLEMPRDWIPRLMEHCQKRGILFFSTPVSPEAVDMLDAEGVELFKISSYDMTNLPLLEYVASKKKPVIFSTGAATLGEVEESARVLRDAGVPFAIMHCIAKYPAPYRYANLAVMDTLRSAFQVPTGFSDNGFADERGAIDPRRVPFAAAQAGADLFEIHITLDRSLPGADHGFATTPDELKAMTRGMRELRERYNAGERAPIEAELRGSPVKQTYDVERYVRDFAYKCLFAIEDIRRGEKLGAANVRVLRPGSYARGLAPRYYKLVVEKARASRDIPRWEPITWDCIL
ncbi:MAG TPA: N-acetylneuraminate synthase family protein [Elusimicrobiota bacterium]|nr:N-acetylneuraminate synthase family protein [Elusimicrobiota bacterium]